MGRRPRPGFYNFPPILPSFMVNWPPEWIPQNSVSWDGQWAESVQLCFRWKAIMIRVEKIMIRVEGERCEMDTGEWEGAECLAETDPSEFRRKWRRSRAGKTFEGEGNVGLGRIDQEGAKTKTNKPVFILMVKWSRRRQGARYMIQGTRCQVHYVGECGVPCWEKVCYVGIGRCVESLIVWILREKVGLLRWPPCVESPCVAAITTVHLTHIAAVTM